MLAINGKIGNAYDNKMKRRKKILLVATISFIVLGVVILFLQVSLQRELSRLFQVGYVKEAVDLSKITCSDSDGGINYLKGGSITLLNNLDETSIKTDRCLNDGNKLQEYFCENNEYTGAHTFDCSSLGENYRCENDACVKNLCDNEIDIEDNLNQELTIDYCTHLKNSNNLKIYFSYKDEGLIIYSVRAFESRDYLLDFDFIGNPNSYSVNNIYENGEEINVSSFNKSEVTFNLRKYCKDDNPYCGVYNIQSTKYLNNYYFVEDGILKYFYDKKLFPSEEIKKNYFEKKITLDKDSINFIQKKLGIFLPIDALVQIDTYTTKTSSFSHSLSTGFRIQKLSTAVINNADLELLKFGNTHEFIHVFFYGTPVEDSWFDEGLADYIESAQRGRTGLYCRKNGWEYGYYDSSDHFVSNSPFVPYSDFTVPPQKKVDLYSSLNSSSYYRSAECFWDFVEKNYGGDALTKVAQAWQATRLIFPPEKKLKLLIKDIINPALGVNLNRIIYERYHYTEENK